MCVCVISVIKQTSSFSSVVTATLAELQSVVWLLWQPHTSVIFVKVCLFFTSEPLPSAKQKVKVRRRSSTGAEAGTFSNF